MTVLSAQYLSLFWELTRDHYGGVSGSVFRVGASRPEESEYLGFRHRICILTRFPMSSLIIQVC